MKTVCSTEDGAERKGRLRSATKLGMGLGGWIWKSRRGEDLQLACLLSCPECPSSFESTLSLGLGLNVSYVGLLLSPT